MRLSVEPTVILVSTKIDDSVIDRLDPEGRSNESESVDNDQFRLPFLLEVRPPNEFHYDSAKAKIASLRLDETESSQLRFNGSGEFPSNKAEGETALGQQGQILRIAGSIDLDSRVTVSYPYSIYYRSLTKRGWVCRRTNFVLTTSTRNGISSR